MQATPIRIDLDSALRDPSSVFARPADVVSTPFLSPTSKLAILEQWETDARSLAVASDESMTGGEPTLLEEVIRARRALGRRAARQSTSPAKG